MQYRPFPQLIIHEILACHHGVMMTIYHTPLWDKNRILYSVQWRINFHHVFWLIQNSYAKTSAYRHFLVAQGYHTSKQF